MEIKYKLFTVLLGFPFLYACSDLNKDSELITEEKPVKESLEGHLNNDALKLNLKAYINKNLKDVEGAVVVQFREVKGVETYVISSILDIESLIEAPPISHFTVSDRLVLIYTGIEDNVSFSSDYIDMISKKAFPHQYKLYKASNELPIPITYSPEIWRLDIKDKEIVQKDTVGNNYLYIDSVIIVK